MKVKPEEILLFAVTASIYCIMCFYLPYRYPEIQSAMFKNIDVLIPGGTSANEAAAILEKAGVVDDAQAMVREMERTGLDRRIKPGLYTLHRAMPRGVVVQMEKAKPVVNKITLIPGTRYKRLFALMGDSPASQEEFENLLKDDNNFYSKVREWLPDRAKDRIIFLLPETYFIAPGEKLAANFITAASKLWYEKVGMEIPQGTDAQSVLQMGVLASIIEGESRLDDERPILAGIFLKRIEKKMRLQSCATVIYSWYEKDVKKTSLTYKDLEIDSPYNTYRNDGLPPGPICVPSGSAWKSAIHPAESNYLFFFAGENGRHIFSKTYDEHISRQRGR